jgi:REP element-mobilizing transposase RayT
VLYLITFTSYGCHMHGDDSGSVDRKHHLYRSPLLEPNPKRVEAESRRMEQSRYDLDPRRRDIVLAAIVERCSDRSWTLRAAHVRTNHVHIVAGADVRPERIMNDLKSYASRCLNRLGLDGPGRKRWARHGSTRWLWDARSVSGAIRYVVGQQGAPMAVFEARETS